MPQPHAPEKGRDPPAQMPAANPDLARVLVSRLQAAAARRVLDLGCGDGAVAAMLTEAGFDVTGIDPAPDNLARARARAPNATFLQRRAEDLPAGLGPFDAACFVNSLHHIDKDRAGLAERHAPQLARAWRENIRSRDGKAALVQPMICWTLTLPDQKGARP